MSRYEPEEWMEGPMQVALLSFNRPDYLKQVVDSIKKQTYTDYKICLFQDGAINKYSWRRCANQDEITQCVEIFKEAFPDSDTYISQGNVGICENWRQAEHTMFLEKGAEEVLFLEDDLTLSPYYFETINNMFNEFRDDPEIGMFNAYGEMKTEGNINQMKPMGHLWSFGTTKEAWLQRQKYYDIYYDTVAGIDYAYRPIQKIYELYNKWGASPTVAHSQDGAKCIAASLCNQIKISTQVNLAKYIGQQGFHATPTFYNERGFGEMPVYDEGPLTEFNVDKESIRKELTKEYMVKQ